MRMDRLAVIVGEHPALGFDACSLLFGSLPFLPCLSTLMVVGSRSMARLALGVLPLDSRTS
jgi:hypothetical protein